jgi:hypothetical protein
VPQLFWEAKLLDLRVWRGIKIASLLLLVVAVAVLTNTVRFRKDKVRFMHAIVEQRSELQQAEYKLRETTHLLANAEKRLGFLSSHKTTVEVTAFTGRGTFANGLKTDHSYAVPNHTLPDDKLLSIALSPTAQRQLHARMNDYIVLLEKNTQKARLARFVDTTSENEVRPVVDVFFEKAEEALTFGRQQFIAIDISEKGSPFQE